MRFLKLADLDPLDTGRKLNVLCTFNLRPVPTGNEILISFFTVRGTVTLINVIASSNIRKELFVLTLAPLFILHLRICGIFVVTRNCVYGKHKKKQ